ncbi:hypothetical protein EDD86DRAFT_245648 [Gorgonomyces haynaldii]|nr:hypothetical protein EDD86DRAFT_245648 [Gorgonomyces haynaldii]
MFKPSKLSPLKKAIVLIVTILVLSAIIAPVTSFFNYQEGVARKAKGEPNAVASAPPDNFDGLLVYASLSALDTANYASKFRFRLQPSGSYGKELGLIPVAAKNFTIEFSDAKTVTFNTNQRLTVQDISLPWEDSDVNSYPFDQFINAVVIHAFEGPASAPRPVPVATYLDAAAQGYKADISVVDLDTGLVYYELNISRSATTKFFSIFVMTLLWLIGIAALAFTATFYFFGFTEAPVAALNATLLFAVPNVRNAQPGIPTIGCTADVASFFWVMGLLGINQVILLIMFFRNKYLKTKADLEKKTSEETMRLTVQ